MLHDDNNTRTPPLRPKPPQAVEEAALLLTALDNFLGSVMPIYNIAPSDLNSLRPPLLLLARGCNLRLNHGVKDYGHPNRGSVLGCTCSRACDCNAPGKHPIFSRKRERPIQSPSDLVSALAWAQSQAIDPNLAIALDRCHKAVLEYDPRKDDSTQKDLKELHRRLRELGHPNVRSQSGGHKWILEMPSGWTPWSSCIHLTDSVELHTAGHDDFPVTTLSSPQAQGRPIPAPLRMKRNRP